MGNFHQFSIALFDYKRVHHGNADFVQEKRKIWV